ncbi:MAG: hypothetical protein CMJ18_14440 [Phycisphaeraceae bacterium]|nr:hypothetical protein [Phycisphaeraceae bacterium]
MKRPALIHLLLALVIILLGGSSRLFREHVPTWYALYAGDFFWSMVVYLLIVNVFRLTVLRGVIVALCCVYAIEISQLFHPPWLEYVRSLRISALVLGFGFLWSDIVAYTLGILVVAAIDMKLSSRGRCPTQDREPSA